MKHVARPQSGISLKGVLLTLKYVKGLTEQGVRLGFSTALSKTARSFARANEWGREGMSVSPYTDAPSSYALDS